MANEIRILRTDKEQPPLAVQILDALRNIINPAKEDGNLALIKSKTDNLDVPLSTRLAPTHLNIDAEKDLQVDIKSLPPVIQQSIRRVLQYPEGTDIDPRQIRALTPSDEITVYGSQAQKLLQRATTYDLLVQLRNNGVEIDPRDIRALTASDIVTIANQIARDADSHGQVDVLTYPGPSSGQLPSALTAGGNLKTAILEPLPAGSNTIGNVNAIKSGTWNIDNLLNPHPVQLTPEAKIPDANQYSGTYAPTAAGSITIIAAVTGKVIRVYDFSLWNSGTADVTVELYFGTSGKRLFKGLLSAKTGVLKSFVRPWESNASDSLVLALSAAGTCDYCIGAVQV